MAPFDWMKSTQWLANVGHFLAGLAVIAIVADWTHTWTVLASVTYALTVYALVKEYVVDLRLESGETWRSSTVDFIGYMAGALVGWLSVLGAHALGRW